MAERCISTTLPHHDGRCPEVAVWTSSMCFMMCEHEVRDSLLTVPALGLRPRVAGRRYGPP